MWVVVIGMEQALNQEPEVECELLWAVEAYALDNRGSPPSAGLYAVFGVALVTLVQVGRHLTTTHTEAQRGREALTGGGRPCL